YHVTNVLIHMASVLVVYALLAALVPTAGAWIWFSAAAIYGLHPMLTGAVDYLAGRSSLLCGMFYFAAFWFFLLGLRRSSWNNFGLMVAAIACAWLAWQTKQEAITLPLLLIAMLWEQGRLRWQGLALVGAVPGALLLVIWQPLLH